MAGLTNEQINALYAELAKTEVVFPESSDAVTTASSKPSADLSETEKAKALAEFNAMSTDNLFKADGSVRTKDSEANNSFLNNTIKDFGSRWDKSIDLLKPEGTSDSSTTDFLAAYNKTETNFARKASDTALAVGGQLVLGTAGDLIGNTMGVALEGVGLLLPEGTEEAVVKNASEFWQDFTKGTVAGQIAKKGLEAAGQGVGMYKSWAKQNPKDALRLESAFNIASFLNPTKEGVNANFKLAPEALNDSLDNLLPNKSVKTDVKATNESVSSFEPFESPQVEKDITPPKIPTMTAEQLEKLKIKIEKSNNPNKISILANIEKGLAGVERGLLKTADEVEYDRALKLSLPLEIGDRLLEETRSTGVNIVGTKKYQPTAYEIEVAQEVAASGIKNTSNHQVNVNVLRAKITEEAEALTTALHKYDDKVLPRNYVDSVLVTKVSDTLRDTILIKGDAGLENIVTNIQKALNKILDTVPSTPAGLLEARKLLDKEAKKQGALLSKDDSKRSALSFVVSEYRKAVNELIQKTVGVDEEVLKSLKKQSLKYSALDNIAPKAALQYNTFLGRSWQNVQGVAGAGRDSRALAYLALGSAGLNAFTATLPYVTATLVGVGGAAIIYQGAISPRNKRAVAKLISLTNKAIKTTKDSDKLKTLRYDRAALLELMKLPTQEEEEKE